MYTKLVGTYGQGHAQMRTDWQTDPFTRSLSPKICCYSSAALHEMWRVWQCEGKKVLEAPTGRFPNGRVDIYPGRLWAVAAAPTEMIQPAIWNIGFYSDGWNSYCAVLGDVWGLCVYILSLNLPTHSVLLSNRAAMLTVILHSKWWYGYRMVKEQGTAYQQEHKDSVFHHVLLNHTCKTHVSGRRRDEHLNTKHFQSMFVFTSLLLFWLLCSWGSQWFVSACCCNLKLDSGRQYNTDQAKSYESEILLSIYKLAPWIWQEVPLYFKLYLNIFAIESVVWWMTKMIVFPVRT